MESAKDFSSISPSAKSLLLLKANTDIPFAKELAALMSEDEVFDLDFKNKDLWFWFRVLHFETRYKSIELLLDEYQPQNILEVSSGYSLRGLARCMEHPALRYIDTDLPEVVAQKKEILAAMGTPLPTNMQLESLDVTDRERFLSIVSQLEGPLTIVNEGLLMYLNIEEKKQLCQTIHAVLKKYGGYWITADIYTKLPEEMRRQMPQAKKGEADFMEQHKIEENKFDSYEDAAIFFEKQGFRFVEEAVVDAHSLSCAPELIKLLPEEVKNSKAPPPKIQATWVLSAV